MRSGSAIVILLIAGLAAPLAAQSQLILDENASWRRYYRFATDHVSPQALKAEGAGALDAATLDRVKKDTEKALNRSARDSFAVFRPSAACLLKAREAGTSAAVTAQAPANADWRDYVFIRMFYDPYTAPPVADDWTSPDFDDSSWVSGQGTFQQELPLDVPPEAVQGNMAKVHVGVLQYIGTGMHSAFYRTRFEAIDPAKAGDLTLKVVYRGGVRLLVNGREIARGHLPQGRLAPETPADDYPLEAYKDENKRDRRLGPVKVPQAALVKGSNVLAVEVRASDLHPVMLAKVQSKSWNALHDRENLWRHGYISKIELRGPAAGVVAAKKRPPGTQVWVEDIHRRVRSTDFPLPGESPGTANLVGARNGSYSAQIVIGTDKDLAGLTATVGALKLLGGNAEIPASAVRVLYGVPIPVDELSDKLGDERGLDPKFPAAKELADFAAMRKPGACVFDQLTSAPPARVPAGTSRPIWLTVSIPRDSIAGKYAGAVSVAAMDMTPVSVPIEVETIDWTLPDPKDFKTFVACEQNPYAAAKFYGVALWSEGHFRLLDASFREMGRIGNDWLNVPVLARTEFGNKDDSPIRWVRRRDGSMSWDYTVLDRYLDLAVRHWGKPRVVMFAVMHGMPMKAQGSAPGVNVFDERTAKTASMPAGPPNLSAADKKKIWEPFARALYEHMKSKGLEKSMRWGFPLDAEADHELVVILGDLLPDVKWVGSPHQIGKWGFPDPKHYDAWGTVRYFDNWPGWRMDLGWKTQKAHLAIPRIDSSVQSLHTASHPFAMRVFTDHALALGRAGICRVGCDEWAGAHYDGMQVPTWIVGMPVLFTLWPGAEGAETSARHEALLEGIQEGEARIAVEQAIDSGRVTGANAKRLQNVLDEHFRQTSFFQNKLCIFELEKYYYGWQQRSRTLYGAAAEAAK